MAVILKNATAAKLQSLLKREAGRTRLRQLFDDRDRPNYNLQFIYVTDEELVDGSGGGSGMDIVSAHHFYPGEVVDFDIVTLALITRGEVWITHIQPGGELASGSYYLARQSGNLQLPFDEGSGTFTLTTRPLFLTDGNQSDFGEGSGDSNDVDFEECNPDTGQRRTTTMHFTNGLFTGTSSTAWS